jgi:hypothetical protein
LRRGQDAGSAAPHARRRHSQVRRGEGHLVGARPSNAARGARRA